MIPLDVESAAEVVCGCVLDLARVRSEDERTFHLRTLDGIGRGIRNTWLRERDKGVAKVLLDLGVPSPDDVSGLILAAAWHRANGQPFDPAERVKCWEDAWKRALEANKRGYAKRWFNQLRAFPSRRRFQ